MSTDGEVGNEKEIELLEETALEDPSLKSVLTNITTSMDKMAASFLVMSENIMGSKQSSVMEDDSCDTPRKRRKRSHSFSSDNNSNASDTDEQTRALLSKRVVKTSGKDGETSKEQHPDLLKGVAQDFDDEEQTDAVISDNLAGILNKRWSNPLNPSKLKEKMDKYSRPENCIGLKVPRVNPEIWNKLEHFTKRQDLRASSLQKTIVKVGTILAKTTDCLLNLREEDNSSPKLDNLVLMNTDAVALLGHSNYELSLRRREAIKPTLNKEYQALCSPQVPITDQLFGDDLQSQLSNITASNKLSTLATRKYTGNSNKNWNGQRGNAGWKDKRDNKPFLWNRQRKPPKPPFQKYKKQQ